MNDLTVKKELRFMLPEIRIQHPKTGEPLCIVTPAAGSVFDIRIPEGITSEELLIVVSDFAQFCYRSTMAVQKRLMNRGWTHEQLGELFFPEAEKVDADAPPEVLYQKLADAMKVAMAGSEKWQGLLSKIPMSKLSEVGMIDSSGWERTDYEQVLLWLMDEQEEMPKCISDYLKRFDDGSAIDAFLYPNEGAKE
ncbi:MAG: hypothetical protein GY841_15660 [FCB group bacterium]|nr:hypothetical protein [FCB group bacterium]